MGAIDPEGTKLAHLVCQVAVACDKHSSFACGNVFNSIDIAMNIIMVMAIYNQINIVLLKQWLEMVPDICWQLSCSTGDATAAQLLNWRRNCGSTVQLARNWPRHLPRTCFGPSVGTCLTRE